MKTIKAYEFRDHGWMYPDYFQGAGLYGTDFDACFTGAGSSVHQAIDDALEQAASSDPAWDVSTCEKKEKGKRVIRSAPYQAWGTDYKVPFKADECYYYVTVYLKS